MGHWIIDSLDSFKRLIHSETSQLAVLMNGPLNHWLTRFIQTADSFRNESIVCPYEWATESLTHSIHSNGWFIQKRVNCLSLWMGHWIIDSLDSFKWLIHLETSQLSVLMNRPLNHWLTRFIQTADSFRNESIVCPYEWATESLTHLIHSNTWIRSETKHRCMLLRDTTVLLCLWSLLLSSAKLSKNSQYFVENLSHFILSSCLLKNYCIKSVSHCNRADIVIQGNIMAV